MLQAAVGLFLGCKKSTDKGFLRIFFFFKHILIIFFIFFLLWVIFFFFLFCFVVLFFFLLCRCDAFQVSEGSVCADLLLVSGCVVVNETLGAGKGGQGKEFFFFLVFLFLFIFYFFK